MPVTGNKAELAAKLGISLPTLSAWMMRYRPEFPVQSTGANGRSYVFDFDAVFEFLRVRREEQDKAGAERDEQLAQLRLPFDVPGADLPVSVKPSIADEIKALQLRKLQREEAERSGALVSAQEVESLLAMMLGKMSRNAHDFHERLGDRVNWPPSFTQSIIAEFADLQRATVKDLQSKLAPQADNSDVRQRA